MTKEDALDIAFTDLQLESIDKIIAKKSCSGVWCPECFIGRISDTFDFGSCSEIANKMFEKEYGLTNTAMVEIANYFKENLDSFWRVDYGK